MNGLIKNIGREKPTKRAGPIEQGTVKTQLEIVEVKRPHSVLTYAFFMVQLFRDVPGLHNKNYCTIQPVKLGLQDDAQPKKWSQTIYYLICFQILILSRMA